MASLQDKLQSLRDMLEDAEAVAVAFSGGADSTLLLDVARETLGENAVAVTVRSRLCPAHETEEAAAFCRARGIRHQILEFDPMSVPEFAENTPDRCYFCKRAIFDMIEDFAAANGYIQVVDGTNADDDADYRPGMRALRELQVASPLREAGFTKADVRAALAERGLAAATKPSNSCLATRIPYGERITEQALARIDAAENFLRTLGANQVRVRSHGAMARIEVPAGDIQALAGRHAEIARELKRLGFDYVALDLEGYRTGSMNETLPAGKTPDKNGADAKTENLGFAQIDLDRPRRQGMAETIYGAGKTAEQIVEILRAMNRLGQKPVLATRIDGDKAAACAAAFGGEWEYFPQARIGRLGAPVPPFAAAGEIAVVCGGTSDIGVAEEAAITIETLGGRVRRIYDVGVAGLHRLLERAGELRAARAVVAVAGMEGALPSVVGGLVPCPVVAVPTSVGYGASFGGAAALLAMLNSCAAGVSVVNIDNGFGAGVLAHRIACGGTAR